MTQEEQDIIDIETELFNAWLYSGDEEDDECNYMPDPMTTSKALKEDAL